MKKFISLVLTIMMLIGIAIPASAYEVGAEEPGDSAISICAVNELQYSVLANITIGNNADFNCYAYSIGRYYEYLNPGDVVKK